MKNIATLVLGGGRGARLYPLTRYRSKPAVPLAGKYRLIDIPISNCINSGLRRIYVLTQFMSVSLHRHIRTSYWFDQFSGGFVEILAAQQTLDDSHWYQGTADAVRKNIRYVNQHDIDYVLILSGDQLYRMNFADMIKTHQESGADATIAAMPVAREAASGLGIMQIDDSGRVLGFVEKPKTQEQMDSVRMDPAWIDARGIPSRGRDLLASMGIYVFNRKFLVDVLQQTDYQDFGKEVFPESIRTRNVHVHLFDGYWEDIGTIGSFYRCNLDLASAEPPFDFVSTEFPIYTRSRYLPPSRLGGATIRNSVIADGCLIGTGAVIENSVIGTRCQIGKYAMIRNSVLMGADFYESPAAAEYDKTEGRPPLGIGQEAMIQGAIIDKNCHIGRKVRVINEANVEEKDFSDQVFIRDRVVVVEKDAALPDGWKM
jgi:glucose-1-phosphate adenylyltransferase